MLTYTPDRILHPFLSGILESLSVGSHWNNEQILREEIFSIERLEQHAQTLAAAQAISVQPGFRRSLRARLRNNEKILLSAYRAVARAVDEGRSITPAAEWVLDNYHVVEEQIREIREDLPPGFYRQLPKLAEGPFAGLPRVFGIAWAYVAHTDSRFDPETLRRFVRAYQSVAPLTIGELWAVAITLRVVLVENLRRVAQRIVASRVARQEADNIADRLLGVNGQKVTPDALLKWQGKKRPLVPSFAVQLVQRLRDQDPRVVPALEWLEERITAEGGTPKTWCAKSTSARAPRTSRCATSSPACGSCPTWTGRSSSKASAWSTRCSTAPPNSPPWISRRATCTAPPSKSWAVGRGCPSCRSRARC